MLMKFLVVEKHTQTVANSEQVSVMLCQLADAFHLFIKKIPFEVVAQMRVIVGGGHIVQI